MEQLVYISTSRRELTQADVEEILTISRQNNVRDGLSGLLIIGGQRFLQVLEGPHSLLAAAYQRIASDKRHFALVELSRKAVPERSFPDWAMGFEDVSFAENLSEIVDRLIAPVSDPNLRADLSGFAALHGRAA